MKTILFNTIKNERAGVLVTGVGDDKQHLAISNDILDNIRVGPAMTEVRDKYTSAVEEVVKRSDQLSELGRINLAKRLFGERLAPTFKAAQRAVGPAIGDLEKREMHFQPKFGDDMPPARREAILTQVRTMKLPETIEAVKAEPLTFGAVLVEAGAVRSGLSADMFQHVRELTQTAQAARQMMDQGGFRTEPSADDPIGGKPNWEAATAAGERVLSGLRAERELLASIPNVLAGFVTAVALMTDMQRADAFAMLTA